MFYNKITEYSNETVNISKYIKVMLHSTGVLQGSRNAHQAGN